MIVIDTRPDRPVTSRRWVRTNGTGRVLDLLMDKRGHILIVDDEPRVRTLLRRCLEGEGFTVSEAKDGAEMRLRLERETVSLITLDLASLGKEKRSRSCARDSARRATSPSSC